MIPRHQAVILIVLVLASLVMGGVLFRMREKAHDQMVVGQDSAPTQAPQVAAPEQATLLVASDDDNSLRSQVHSLPLPADPGAKARAVLGKLLDLYAASDSTHPVPGGATSVEQVFLLPVAPAGSKAAGTAAKGSGAQLAVVNLKSSFAASHPSGLETESLTVLSICGTLHANLPQVTEVRFLVDGQVRPSLAGHADLTRTYLVADSDAVPASDATAAGQR
jgi:hypothetical protein